MRRHYTLLSLLTAFIVAMMAFGSLMDFNTFGLPISIKLVDTHTALLEPVEGIPLPAGVQAGDRIDPALQPQATRIVIGINSLSAFLSGFLPLGHSYDFVIERDGQDITVPIATVDQSGASGIRFLCWVNLFQTLLTGGLALLALWRGRDRAAIGMALWTLGLVAGGSLLYPADGSFGLTLMVLANVGYLIARMGFLVMAYAVARPILSPRARTLYTWASLLVLVAGAGLYSLGGPVIYAMTGWIGGLSSAAGLLWSASYLMPMLILVSSYQYGNVEQRLRLRWMLASSALFTAGIFVSNSPIYSSTFSLLFTDVTQVLGALGFLYAVLRHRVVDVSVLLDSTLVYGAMTALVVGVLAAVNSLVQHAALGSSASLLLQVVVPLSLGIVLTRVRTYLDLIMERVFFRKKYQADKALRRFARLSPQYEHTDELMTAAIRDIRQHLSARGVAIYERRGEEYHCIRQAGETAYPEHVKVDDTAFVAARAEQDDIDLVDLNSALGNDGYVFPMLAHSEMQAVLICANRPGEHYAVDERRLLAYVAEQMGMALYALRMKAKAKIVERLAQAPLTTLPEVQVQARMLLSAASA